MVMENIFIKTDPKYSVTFIKEKLMEKEKHFIQMAILRKHFIKMI
jgi:hypothetical protein